MHYGWGINKEQHQPQPTDRSFTKWLNSLNQEHTHTLTHNWEECCSTEVTTAVVKISTLWFLSMKLGNAKCQIFPLLKPHKMELLFLRANTEQQTSEKAPFKCPKLICLQWEQRRRRKIPIKLNPQAQTSHYRHMSSGNCSGPPPLC